MAKKKQTKTNQLNTPDWIDTPGLKHIIEKEVPLAGKLLAEGKRHVLVRGQPRIGKSPIRDKICEQSKLEILGKINCASLAPSLIDSILFGIKDKTATGVKGRTGLLADTSKSPQIVILEEIGELPKELQAKLLVYLETGEFLPVGGNWEELGISSIRIIATSNAEDDKFRPDFLARFWQLKVPPIHERREDIPKFLNRFLDGEETKLSPEEWFYLMTYNWPGGVSEIEDICIKIKYYLFKLEKSQRNLLARKLFNLEFYTYDPYFQFFHDSVDHEENPTLTKLFPHFDLSFFGSLKPTINCEYNNVTREWDAWCYFFNQDPKTPFNIYVNMQNQKQDKHRFFGWGLDFLLDSKERIDTLIKCRPLFAHFTDFLKNEGLSNKKGAKLLSDLREEAYYELFSQEEEEEEVNINTKQQPSFEKTSPEDYRNQFWEYQVEKGHTGSEIEKLYGIKKKTAEGNMKTARQRLAEQKD